MTGSDKDKGVDSHKDVADKILNETHDPARDDDGSLVDRVARWGQRVLRPHVSPEEAFYTTILGAAWADQELAREEQDEIDALIQRTHALRKLGPAKRAALLSRVEKGFRDATPDGRRDMVEKAIESTPQDRAHRLAMFINALDIAMSDGLVRPTEQTFMLHLGDRLEIDPQMRLNVIEVMCLKNQIPHAAFTTPLDADHVATLDNPFGALTGAATMDLTGAFLTQLWCAVLIDGEEDAEEVRELEAIIGRSPSFHRMRETHRGDIHLIRDEIRGLAGDRDGLTAKGDAAAKALSTDGELAAAVFAHCCDLVFADGRVKNAEIAYLRDLHQKLDVPEDIYRKVVEVITLKNRY